MRRDIKEKIKEAARRAGIALALAELGAMALGEPVAGIAPALAEPGACVASSGHERGQKRERLQSGEERPEEKRDEDRPSGLEDLERIEVRKAIAELGEMPAGGGGDRVRDLLQQWRAAGQESNAHKRRTYLRKLATSFHIDVARKDNDSLVKLSNRIGQEFVQRVSALRLWRPMGASTSGSAATAAHGEQSDAAELALAAEGMTASSSHEGPAAGSSRLPEKVPTKAQRREDKQESQERSGENSLQHMDSESAQYAAPDISGRRATRGLHESRHLLRFGRVGIP